MAQAYLDEIHRPVTQVTLSKFPHSTMCRHALHDTSVDIEISDPTSSFKRNCNPIYHDISCPYPILRPEHVRYCEVNGYDSCLELVRNKIKWDLLKDNLLRTCQRSLPVEVWNAVKTFNFNPGDNIKVPKSLLFLSKHLSEDPDKYFFGMYNWFYSGSNLSMIDVLDEKLLLHVSGFAEKLIYLTRSFDAEGQWSTNMTNNLHSISWPDGSPVYEIDVNDNYFSTRQRHLLSTFRVTKNCDTLKVDKGFSTKSNVPFVSSSFCVDTYDKMCSLDVEKTIRVYDTSVSRILMEAKVPVQDGQVDNWGLLKFINLNSIQFMDRKRVGFFDTRVGLNKLCQEWSQVGEGCNVFSASCLSRRDLLYLGTRHNILVLDQRNGYVMCSTHNLPHHPAVMKTCMDQNGMESLFMGSQRSDNIHMCTIHDMKEEGSFALSPMKSIFSPRWTLFSARNSSRLSAKYITARFTSSMTGLHCFQKDDGIGVLRLTSMGDLFLQNISVNNQSQDTKVDLLGTELLSLECWQIMCLHRLCSAGYPVFNSDGSSTKSNLTDKLFEEIKHYFEMSTESLPEDELFVEDENWQVAKEQLLRYCDYLAPRLSKNWDIQKMDIHFSDVNSNCAEPELPSSDEDMDLNDRVTQWMEKSVNVSPGREDEANYQGPREIDEYEEAGGDANQEEDCEFMEEADDEDDDF